MRPLTTCESFPTKFSERGTPVPCPVIQTITLDITASTQLLLRNRSRAVLANMTPGDLINVFGYYPGPFSTASSTEPANTLHAYIVRDLSKPVPGIADIVTMIQRLQRTLTQLMHQIGGAGSSTRLPSGKNPGTSMGKG